MLNVFLYCLVSGRLLRHLLPPLRVRGFVLAVRGRVHKHAAHDKQAVERAGGGTKDNDNFRKILYLALKNVKEN